MAEASRSVCVALLMVAVACGGRASRKAQPDVDPDVAKLAAWDTARKRAVCVRAVRCGRYSTLAGCLDDIRDGAWPDKASWYERFFGGVDLFAELVVEYSLADAATLDECLTEIEDGVCNPSLFRPTSCDRALVAKNPRAEGESCSAPAFLPRRPCHEGLVCEGAYACQVCTEPAASVHDLAEGEPCDAWDACEPGLFCTSATEPDTCVPLPRLGDPCGQSLCAEGICHREICVAYAKLGEPCSEAAPCQHDLTCDGSKCVPLKLTGESCPRFSSSAGDHCALFCMFEEPDAPEGTCGAPSNAPPTSMACPLLYDTAYCPAGTYFDTRGQDLDGDITPEYCMCLPSLPSGAACEPKIGYYLADDPCTDGHCTDGVCLAARADGSACTTFVECISENCDETGTCAPACAQ